MKKELSCLAVAVALAGCGTKDASTEDEAPVEEAPPAAAAVRVDGVTDTEVVFGTHTDLSGAIAKIGRASCRERV